jgi:hypothetical protein
MVTTSRPQCHGWNADNMQRAACAVVALDPSFWRCLGKTLGWDEEVAIPEMQDWFGYAHKLYSFVLTGCDTDEFWKQLLD